MTKNPKYRSLSTQELQELEREFVEFLVLNGITAEDWEKIKQNEISKAEAIITLFSDVVFEEILRKTRFLEYRGKNEIRTYQCLESKLVLVGMREESGDDTIDFTDAQFIDQAVRKPPQGLKIYTTNKKYEKGREVELFEMIASGCIITDGKLFKTLSQALV